MPKMKQYTQNQPNRSIHIKVWKTWTHRSYHTIIRPILRAHKNEQSTCCEQVLHPRWRLKHQMENILCIWLKKHKFSIVIMRFTNNDYRSLQNVRVFSKCWYQKFKKNPDHMVIFSKICSEINFVFGLKK